METWVSNKKIKMFTVLCKRCDISKNELDVVSNLTGVFLVHDPNCSWQYTIVNLVLHSTSCLHPCPSLGQIKPYL